MRVLHSPCSWLNEIVALDSVAGNTLMGMVTRLTLRWPFQVARAAMVPILSDARCSWCAKFSRVPSPELNVLALVVIDQIEAGAAEVDVVLRDLVPQQAPGGAVMLGRHLEVPCKIAQPLDDDERHLLLPFPPLDAADVLVPDEAA